MAHSIAPPLNWPDGLSPGRFLREYWQKRPLLIRDALPGFVSPLDANELAGLACEPDVESRLVLEHGRPPWQVQQGPFDEEQLGTLATSGWSLLVQDVDKHLPDLAVIADRFDFVPNWRFDDLMVSVAPPGGSVGAHVDAYDVFLLQGAGERTWSIGPAILPGQEPLRYRPDAQLKVLAGFTAEAQWTLGPGDALYLPPGVPHHGVAGDSCITWSVGFRAPSHQQLLDAAGLRASRPPPDDALYEDPDLAPGEVEPGMISTAALHRANAILAGYCDRGPPATPNWFGELVTEPKPWLRAEPGEFSGGVQALAAVVEDSGGLERHGMVRLARTADARLLFVDGDSYPVSAALAELVSTLCARRYLDAALLARWLRERDAMELLHALVCRGSLWPTDTVNESTTARN